MAVKQPIRRCTSMILLGLCISMIAVHFSGFASMPPCVSMKPRNLPRSMSKTHFSRLSLRLYCRNAENNVLVAWRFDNHVVDVHFDILAHQVVEYFVHQSLVSCSCIF